jgi:hypothetical protein
MTKECQIAAMGPHHAERLVKTKVRAQNFDY